MSPEEVDRLPIVRALILLDGIKNRLDFREEAGPIDKGTYIP